MDKSTIPKATLGRLPMYLDYLRSLSSRVNPSISATAIAKALNLGEVQVRKDLSAVSGAGRPKIGYDTENLKRSLEDTLCQGKITNAVLVGAGRLGKALLEFDEFKNFGVCITAAFDSDERTLSATTQKPMLPMEQFESFCKEHNIQIGIITVSENAAQTVCDRMISCGITAIWNFAPCRLTVPEGTLLQQENLALSLAHLNHQLCN